MQHLWKLHCLIFLVTFMTIKYVQGQSNNEATTIQGNELENTDNLIQKTHDVISSPTGKILVQVTKELLSRSFGNGKSLSLNLTNFLIIVFLKTLIFIAGFIAAGSWTMYARGRDVRGDYWITENEKNLYMGFLAADLGDYGCLSKASCEVPGLAKQYAHAARALLNGYEKFKGESIEDIEEYQELIRITEEGAMKGYRGIACEMYSCRI